MSGDKVADCYEIMALEAIEASDRIATETPTPAACPGCGGPTRFAANIGTFCPSKDCDRVDDMRPAPSLASGWPS